MGEGKQDYIVRMNRLDSVAALQNMFLSKMDIDAENGWKEIKVPKPETLADFQSLSQKTDLDINDFYEVLTDSILKGDEEKIKLVTGEIEKSWGKFVDIHRVTRTVLNGIVAGKSYNLKQEQLAWFTDHLSKLVKNTTLKDKIKPIAEFKSPPKGTIGQLYLTDLYTIAYWDNSRGEETIGAVCGPPSGGLSPTVDITRHKDLKAFSFDEVIGDKSEIIESRKKLFARFDGKAIATNSMGFASGLSILTDGEIGLLKGLQELQTEYGLYLASYGQNDTYNYPVFHYNEKSKQPFPYVSIEDSDPFIVFDGELLKDRKTILQHGYKMIDGKVLTSSPEVIGMWWPPAFRPYLVEWFNQMDVKTKESILGDKTPEQFLFME